MTEEAMEKKNQGLYNHLGPDLAQPTWKIVADSAQIRS